MINFNMPPVTGDEIKNLGEVLLGVKHCGDGNFTKKCHAWFESVMPIKKALLTTSCTHSLEMAALLTSLTVGDEVILPSYTFVSTANSIVLRGAVPVFIDIDPVTMNINADLIEEAITEKTKAIWVVHYAGVSCDMDMVRKLALKHNLSVVEDAAQAIGSYYREQPLGTIGDLGCFSFHETKNITCGEGGLLTINRNEDLIEKAEIIREKGTNRSKFFRGQVDKYTWENLGSSYLPSEFNAAVLYAQINKFDEIQTARMRIWNKYHDELKPLVKQGLVECMTIPDYSKHNAHMFWVKLKNLEQRTQFIDFGKKNEITHTFHYIPLHSSPAGHRFGRFHGADNYTTHESERLVRLPLYFSMTDSDQYRVIESIFSFFGIKV